MVVVYMFMVVGLLFACQGKDQTSLNTGTDGDDVLMVQFDYDAMEDLVFYFNETQEDFIFVSGHNIVLNDYYFQNQQLTIKSSYLAYLQAGIYSYQVHFLNDTYTIKIEVLDRYQAYRLVNGDFESGDLLGWSSHTVFKGENDLQVFSNDAVVPTIDLLGHEAAKNLYMLGYNQYDLSKDLYEEKMGYMKSSSFLLGGSGYISIDIGGAANPNISYVSIKRMEDNYEIARLSNQHFDASEIVESEAGFIYNMNTYIMDLSAYIGDDLYIEIYDLGGLENDFIMVDNIVTYYQDIPDFGYLAINIKPVFSQDFIPNQLINGDFTFGLNYYQEVNPYGLLETTFQVSGGHLDSQVSGNNGRGLLRSSIFELEGEGLISLEIAGGQGERYDKNTYISIRLASTNEEIYRFANDRGEGSDFVKYFIDLYDYIGEDLYIEFVDNAVGDFGAIFVRNIRTYYATLEDYDFAMVAKNLNY